MLKTGESYQIGELPAAGDFFCKPTLRVRSSFGAAANQLLSRRTTMFRKLAGLFLCLAALPALAGEVPRYKVLAPISHGKLTVFPIVAATAKDASWFLTLDEGVRTGEVVVTEAGQLPIMIRRPHVLPRRSGPQVNNLVLLNNSDRPLLLLAGEIVTGGKQDRVIGKDRIVPAHSDPIDLSVFCVEPGRWTGATSEFKSMGAQMAQPSVRREAMAKKDQQAVWDSVRSNAGEAVEVTAAAAPMETQSAAIGGLRSTTSYARVMGDKNVQQQVDKIAEPVTREYKGLISELRARNAVGVVAAVNGQIVWADIFASPQLLERYWPKLVRSYAAEAMTTRIAYSKLDVAAAQAFVDSMEGKREVSETEPGVFRQTEITGDGYLVFELASLLPKMGFEVHIAKMVQ
jgi:hypothetical protein